MNLKELTREEIELLSYTDLTNLILKEEKKAMNTPTIFHKICDLLGYSEEEYASKIGDYYTSLTLDKRFLLLESGEWDLTSNHKVKIELDDLDDEEIEEEEEEIEEEEELIEEEESIDTNDDVEDLDEDLDDLSIVPDEELEEN